MKSLTGRRSAPGATVRPGRWRMRAAVGLAVSSLCAGALITLHPGIALGDAGSVRQTVAVPDAVARQAAADGEADVIVQLAPADPQSTERQGRKLVDDVAGDPAEGSVLEHVGVVAMSASPEQLEELATSDVVRRIEPDTWLAPALDQSTGRIGAPQAWAAGLTGKGEVVAVIDSGLDTSHPSFQNKPIYEACFTNGSCPNGQAAQEGPGSAKPCTFGLACEHGTHVAGIIASDAGQNGVAPDAGLVAIQVFSRSDSATDCGAAGAPCPRARTSDVLAALDFLYANKARFGNLVAVNLSLSSDSSSPNCDSSILAGAVDKLKSIDVATIVASGNGGFTNGLGVPACISNTVSVGATYADSDAVWPLSNVSSQLDLVAPGVAIDSPAPGGGWSPTTGTSAAAPHVAGAWALAVQQLGPRPVDEILQYLQSTATPVVDSLRDGTNLTLRRLDVRSLAGGQPTGPAADGVPTQQNGASSLPVSGDFNGDKRTDIFWYAKGGASSVWLSEGDGRFQTVPAPSIGADLTPVAGDFDGNGRTDLFWGGRPGAGNMFWMSRGDGSWDQAAAPATPGDGYVPVGGDFDGNGIGDILWHGGVPSIIWYGSGSGGFRTATTGAAGLNYLAVAGDFDGNGMTDVLWWDGGGGRDWTWLSQGDAGFSAHIGSELDGPFVPTTGDFDGDGRTDIMWYSTSGGTSWLWTVYNGWQFTGHPYAARASNPPFVPVGGDFDGDHRAEIYWYAPGAALDLLLPV